MKYSEAWEVDAPAQTRVEGVEYKIRKQQYHELIRVHPFVAAANHTLTKKYGPAEEHSQLLSNTSIVLSSGTYFYPTP